MQRSFTGANEVGFSQQDSEWNLSSYYMTKISISSVAIETILVTPFSSC